MLNCNGQIMCMEYVQKNQKKKMPRRLRSSLFVRFSQCVDTSNRFGRSDELKTKATLRSRRRAERPSWDNRQCLRQHQQYQNEQV